MHINHSKYTSRFFSKVEKTKNCWLWQKGIDKDGYGIYFNGVKNVLAHRYSYELHLGEIPLGLQIDHLCLIKNCVNPNHLEAVTPKENLLRAKNQISTINENKTHCPSGHKYDQTNTYYRPKGGRGCKNCIYQSTQKHLVKKAVM